MWSTKTTGSGEQKNKVNFPLGVAVDNVKLFGCKPNEKIPGVEFSFSRIDGDDISFLTDTILPPKKEWCLGGKQLANGDIQTADQEYDQKVKQFGGYITYIAINAGVPKEKLDNIKAEDFDDFVKLFCETVMATKEDTLLYLKTVKDKDGYTKLPRFRGKGVVAPMSDGFPVFEYTPFELNLIENSKQEGVEEEEPVPTASTTDTSSFDDI